MKSQVSYPADATAIAGFSVSNESRVGSQNVDRLVADIVKKNQKVHLDQITIRLDPAVLDFIKQATRRSELTIAEFIRGCLDHAMSCDQYGLPEKTPPTLSNGTRHVE